MRPVLYIVFLLLLTSCTAKTTTSGSQPPLLTLTEMVEGFASAGDLSARAIMKTNLLDRFSDKNSSNAFFMLSEGKISGDFEKQETYYQKGDDLLKAYLAEQNITEQEFLKHPKLSEFVLSHFIPSEIATFNQNYDGQEKTYVSAAGNKITLTTDFKRSEATIIVNDVAIVKQCQTNSSLNTSTRLSEFRSLCLIDSPIIKDFDWSN